MRLNKRIAIILALFGLVSSLGSGTTSSSSNRTLIQRIQQIQSIERQKQTILSRGRQNTGLMKSLSELGSISGTVLTNDSASFRNATVQALRMDDGVYPGADSSFTDSVNTPSIWVAAVVSVDSPGVYRIDDLKPGFYKVLAQAKDYADQYYQGATMLDSALTVEVREGLDTPNIDFMLEKITPGTGSISGTVVNSLDGHPLANATVSAYTTSYPATSDGQFYYGQTLSDENGRFTIDGLKNGDYFLTAFADGFIAIYYGAIYHGRENEWDGIRYVTVTEPNETAGIEISLDPEAVISGAVRDENGKAQTGISVFVELAAEDSLSKSASLWDGFTMTDENGLYRISHLGKGTYTVRVEYHNGRFWTSQWYNQAESYADAVKLPVAAGEEKTDVDFTLNPAQGFGSISGTVLNESGIPVPNASIRLIIDPTMSAVFNWMVASTDSLGRYALDQVPYGSYWILCSARTGWVTALRFWRDSETFEDADPVRIDENSPDIRADFTLPFGAGMASIEGFVRSMAGNPLAGASINLKPATSERPDSAGLNAFWAYATSDSNGFYRVDQLPAGSYLLQCSYWENQSFSQQWYQEAESENFAKAVVVSQGEKRNGVDFSLRLRPLYGTLSGTVTDARSCDPMPRAVVQIQPVSSATEQLWGQWWNYSIPTDEKGRFQLDWLAEGLYQVSVYADGGFACYPNGIVPGQAEPVAVIAGETAVADMVVTIRNDGPGIIRGKISIQYHWETDSVQVALKTQSRPIQKTLSGEPLDLAIVTAKPMLTILSWPESEQFYTTLSNPDGTYEIKGLPDGEYVVQSFTTYNLPVYYDNTRDPAEATPVTVAGGRPVENINFSLEPMLYCLAEDAMKYRGGEASVNGSVKDEKGNAVPNASVYLLDQSGQPLSYTNTNTEGVYQMPGIPSGQYYIQACKFGFATTFNGGYNKMTATEPLNVVNGPVQIDFFLSPSGGSGVPSTPTVPQSLTLQPNFPNPFNPSTTIRFGLPEKATIRITIVDLSGRVLRTLWNGTIEAGYHQTVWDAKDDSGTPMPSGVYLYRMESGKNIQTGKMIYLR